jgi:hypothetical protein
MQRIHVFLVCVYLVVSANSAFSQLKTLRTEDLRLVYYTTEHEYVAPYLAACFENSMAFHRQLFGYTPSEEVSVLLQDFDDIGYAGATGVPFNWMSIGIEPFEYVYEVSPTNERINWVMSHELLHVLASDQAAPSDRFFRTAFAGKVSPDDRDPVSLLYSYLTVPRRYAPRWYHEGMAVFMETWMSGGFGRVLGGYDEMVFRTMVADGAHFYHLVGLESEGTTTDFQVGQNAYLYGTRFIAYCAYRYGPEKVVDWVRRSEGTKRRYSAQFKHVFGKNLGDAWSEWIEWEHEWQQANLESVREYPLTEYRVLSERALGSVSRGYYDPDSGKLYSAVLYPAESAHVAEIDTDTWSAKKIANVRAPALYYVTSLAYDEVADRVFFTTDNGHGWRDLHGVDVKTKKTEMLIKNCRTGDLAFNRADKSIWGVRHDNGRSSLVRIPEPYDYYLTLLTLPFGMDIFDIDVSPDGEYFTSAIIDASGRRRLIRAPVDSLMIGETRYDVLFEFAKNTAANFVHSRDGRYLFGTSYYSGVSNVYRYDTQRERMEIITNGDTGFFRPVPVSEDSLIVFRYTSEGFMPVMIGIEPIDLLGYTPEEPQPGDTTAQSDTTTAADSSLVSGEDSVAKSDTTIRAIRFLGQAIVEEHPVVKDWTLGSPREVNLDSLTIEAGDYSAFRNIQLTSVYPIVQSYKTRVAWGLRASFMERNALHLFDIDALYTPSESLPDDEKGHVEATYLLWPWEFSFTYNRADFYDFFGPTKTSRKGYSLAISYDGNVFVEKPRRMDYTLKLSGYAGLEILPQYQNVRAVFEEYLSGYGQLSYTNLGKTIGGVEKERGVSWELNALSNWINPEEATINPDIPAGADSLIRASSRRNYPRVWFNWNYGFLLPWDHSSIWLRPSIGSSLVSRSPEPLNNFYFGGFGNNWIDHQSVDRYREYYAFPGIELNELAGTNYVKLLLEWELPPVRFSSLGVPSFYLNWAHLALFTTGIVTNVDAGAGETTLDGSPLRRELVNVGAQLDIKLVSFFALPYTFSLGYAASFEENRRYSDEFMISLKIF